MGYNGGNKYGAKRTRYKDRVYDSLREATHARDLDISRSAIRPEFRVVEVQYQVPFPIIIHTKYVADFMVKFADGHTEIQDAKGFKTALYKTKKRLMKKQHDIDIIEI